MSLEGVIPAYLFSTAGKEWYAGLGGLKSYSKLLSSLLVGTDLTFVPYQEQLNLYEGFIVKLESFMGVSRTVQMLTLHPLGRRPPTSHSL
jgi:hypothetical protein